jgi:hypothetical protein
MTRFATFATLYFVALFLEPAEKWRHPWFTAVFLLLGLAAATLGFSRRTLAPLLLLATIQPLLTEFPDVANHVNVELVCNLVLLAAIGFTLRHPDQFGSDDDAFDLVRPVLQVTLMLVYALAGFAKLNRDFLDPGVSCVGSMVDDLTRLAERRVAGVPLAVPVAVAIALAAMALLENRRGRGSSARPGQAWRAGLVAAMAGLVSLVGVGVGRQVGAALVPIMACVVIAWELGGGLLLAVPRLQAPLLAFSWTMHASLSFIGFVHFGALAFALLSTFVPDRFMALMAAPMAVPGTRRRVARPAVYLGLAILAGILSGLGARIPGAVCFNLGTLVMLWPVLRTLAARTPEALWPGVPIRRRATPAWLFAGPMCLGLLGLTGYVGLRTAGNFTMFSNLRTEGARSNHLILADNRLKRWDYQEDAVHFTRFDDRLVPPSYRGQHLAGMELPVVEFRKWIYQWTAEGRRVPLEFAYAGEVYRTPDIVEDPVWRTPARSWAMRLLDFRVIQPEGPNRCRW